MDDVAIAQGRARPTRYRRNRSAAEQDGRLSQERRTSRVRSTRGNAQDAAAAGELDLAGAALVVGLVGLLLGLRLRRRGARALGAGLRLRDRAPRARAAVGAVEAAALEHDPHRGEHLPQLATAHGAPVSDGSENDCTASNRWSHRCRRTGRWALFLRWLALARRECQHSARGHPVFPRSARPLRPTARRRGSHLAALSSGPINPVFPPCDAAAWPPLATAGVVQDPPR